MSLYERYDNEAAFRDQFVKPLLNRLGFFGVTELHGTREFGKDFVFSELHRLGGVRRYAAQVKHEETINQGKSVDGLLSQIRQAFATPFRLPDSPRDCHVSAVFVFNSGQITENAKDQMLDELERERYGDNVHFLDGPRLESLQQWAAYQSDRDARMRLHGLLLQAQLNGIICTSILTNLPPVDPKAAHEIEVRGFFLHAIEAYLSQPIGDLIDLNLLSLIWQRAKILDAARSRFTFGLLRADVREREIATIAAETRRMAADIDALVSAIAEALAKISPVG
jgi:hypothetical protein